MSNRPFTPLPLPPTLDLAPLLPILVQAHEAIARYDEAVIHLPNPRLVRRSFETQEAVRSSSIEGTQATLTDVLELDAADVRGDTTRLHGDYREIANYRRAIAHGQELLEKRPLAEVVIKELHRILLNSSRGMHRSPGEFRRHQVHIGPPGATIDEARFIPPEPHKIPELFSDLMKYLHDDSQPDRLIQAAVAHYQFEAIHPFADGNGRVGRIMIPLYLYEKGLTSYPNLYLSEFLEQHRRDYYEALGGVSRGDWHTWIALFLRAVRTQALITKRRVDEIDALYREIHATLPSFQSRYAPSFLDALFMTPIFTRASILNQAELPSKQLASALVDKFCQAGLIVDAAPHRQRNKTFVFRRLLQIVDA